jgi:hypothetical protein
MTTQPVTNRNYFRFNAIPATITSPTPLVKSAINLKTISYTNIKLLANEK